MDPIEAAITAIESREPGEDFSSSQVAKEYGVVRTTLARRHQRVTQARATTNITRRNLTPKQEVELIRYITRLTERDLPPYTADGTELCVNNCQKAGLTIVGKSLYQAQH